MQKRVYLTETRFSSVFSWKHFPSFLSRNSLFSQHRPIATHCNKLCFSGSLDQDVTIFEEFFSFRFFSIETKKPGYRHENERFKNKTSMNSREANDKICIKNTAN